MGALHWNGLNSEKHNKPLLYFNVIEYLSYVYLIYRWIESQIQW